MRFRAQVEGQASDYFGSSESHKQEKVREFETRQEHRLLIISNFEFAISFNKSL